MPRPKRADHTRLANDGQLAYCIHCGAAIRLELPMKVSEYANKITAFARQHRTCKPPAPVKKDEEPQCN